jgi:hypothetical protein
MTTVKKIISVALILLITTILIAVCEKKTDVVTDVVTDPEALYKYYYDNKDAREEKNKECRLLSVDAQMKSQAGDLELKRCSIAMKAMSDKALSQRGGFNLGIVKGPDDKKK